MRSTGSGLGAANGDSVQDHTHPQVCDFGTDELSYRSLPM
jgi:hypothetical protein